MDRYAGLGPYTIAELRSFIEQLKHRMPIAATGWQKDIEVSRADNFVRQGAAKCASAIWQKPQIILWRDSPMYGHFILLHVRHVTEKDPIYKKVKNQPFVVEIFDPCGLNTDDNPKPEGKRFMRAPIKYYLDDRIEGLDRPQNLNGGGLRKILQYFRDKTKFPLTYNQKGPQPATSETCGLHCITRVMCSKMCPDEFARGMRDIASKT